MKKQLTLIKYMLLLIYVVYPANAFAMDATKELGYALFLFILDLFLFLLLATKIKNNKTRIFSLIVFLSMTIVIWLFAGNMPGPNLSLALIILTLGPVLIFCVLMTIDLLQKRKKQKPEK